MKNTNQKNGLTLSNESIKKAGLGDEIAVIGTEGAIVDDCGHCAELDFESIHLPDAVLEIAGIPVGTKLNAFVEEDAGLIHVEAAEYDHDISDVQPHLLELFSNYGICLGELDALLVKGELLHG